MVLKYIFPTESITCFKNLTLTPLTTFSTVLDSAEELVVARFVFEHLLIQPTDLRVCTYGFTHRGHPAGAR
jgi:hypothetical protein